MGTAESRWSSHGPVTRGEDQDEQPASGDDYVRRVRRPHRAYLAAHRVPGVARAIAESLRRSRPA